MGGDNKSHLDPRSEIRVGNVSGENDKWPSWCLKFESYCDPLDWLKYTLRAERSFATTTVASVPEAAQPESRASSQVSRASWSMLSTKMEGESAWHRECQFKASRAVSVETECSGASTIPKACSKATNDTPPWTSLAESTRRGKRILEILANVVLKHQRLQIGT